MTSVYFQDFQEKGISIIQDDNIKGDVYFDYESIGVALHHLFHNALKYTKSNTNLYINFPCDDGVPRIALIMTSLPIEPEEIEFIYDDEYSGKAAHKHGLAGDGTGMGIAKKLLELNGAKISINAGLPESNKLGTVYVENTFTIEFTNKKLRVKA